MEKKLDTMYDLCEVVDKELEELNEKIRMNGGQISDREVKWLKDLTESAKNIKCIIEKLEEHEGYSGTNWDNRPIGRMRTMGDMSRRRSGTRRDSMGRYTRDDAHSEFVMELEDLMDHAPDEHTRKKVESMLNEMR